MYLEISPRQSGKTTRLINAVLDWVEEQTRKFDEEKISANSTGIIFVHNAQMVRIMEDALLERACARIGSEGGFRIECISFPLGETNQIRFNDCVQVGIAVVPPGPNNHEVFLRHVEWNNSLCPLKRFFDEFDFLNLPYTFVPRESDYFCTTPKFVRTLSKQKVFEQIEKDILLLLWTMNRCSCFVFPQLAKPYGSDLPRNELFGTFLAVSLEALQIIDTYQRSEEHQKIVILGQYDLLSTQRKNNSDVVVRHYPTRGRYYVVKNRFGLSRFYLPGNLLNEFLQKPAGKLDWI